MAGSTPDRPRTSAALLLDQIGVMRELYGTDTVDVALGTLPPEWRDELAALTPVGWVDTDIAESIVYALAPRVGRDVMQVHSEIVRIGVERTFRTLWRIILRFTSDSALVSRTPLIYQKTFDRGRLTSRIESPGRAELELLGWRDISDMQLNGLATGIETVLAVAGRKLARVAYERRPDGAFLVASWIP